MREIDDVEAPTPIRSSSFLLWALRSSALGIAVARLLSAPETFNPDGVSYLDVADQLLRFRLPVDAIDYWSPFYPLLIALFKQLPLREIVAVRFLNFCIFILAMIGFERFLRSAATERNRSAISRSILDVVGYGVFIWSTLSLITVESVTPDLMVFAITCYVAAILQKAFRGDPWAGVTLGLLLGLGYLAKAIMLPVGLMFCAATFLFGGRHGRRAFWRAVAMFFLIAAPLVVLLSVRKGHLTFGGSARLNYAWYVGDLPRWIHWQGDSTHGRAISPTKIISEKPSAFSFEEPFTEATYAPWFAPSYWHRGLRLTFDRERQLEAVRENVSALGGILRPAAVALVLLLSVALIATRRIGGYNYALIGVGAAAVALYTLVHVEGRFLAPAFTLISVGLMSRADCFAVARGRRLLCAASILAAVVMIAAPINELVERRVDPSSRALRTESLVKLLVREGAGRGKRVAVIGDGIDASWARRCGLRIVAEVPLTGVPSFARAPQTAQLALLKAFEKAGADLVVAEAAARPKTPGWIRTKDGGFFIHWLHP